MGWTSSSDWTTKGKMKASLRREFTGRILGEATAGNEWWLLCSGMESPAPVIILCLTEKAHGEWGYKDMSESVGPCYYKCPLKFLNLAPEPTSEYSKEWREKVRAYHAAEAAKKAARARITLGCTVKLENRKPSEFKITNLFPLRGEPTTGPWGVYRIPVSAIIEVTP